MKKYQYQLIRYVHDHFTGEYVNVGVVVYSNEDRFLSCKTSSRMQRVTHMFPDADGKWIKRVLTSIQSRLNRLANQTSELFSPSDSLSHITNSVVSRDNSAIQLTEVKMAIDVSLEAAINDLYQTQVEKYMVSKVDKNTLLDEDVWKLKYKTHFEKYGIEKRLRMHEVAVPEDVITFDKSWKNEIWHCYEPLSFVLKEKDTIRDKVYKWAGKLQGLRHSNEYLHLVLLTSISPKHSDLMSFVHEYLQVDSDKLKVDIVTEDNADFFAKRVFEEMELHDRLHN